MKAQTAMISSPPQGDRTTPGHTGSVSTKIPSFDVPLYNGNIIEGHSYIQDVQDTFRSSAMEDYLNSEAHCDQNHSWSGAFASRIRESLKDSLTLGFLSTELNQENNCARVWIRIKNHLSSEDVVTARVMNLWTKLFSLKCEDRDSFNAFYSQFKGITHKLTEHSSVAVQDDTFMRAFLSRTIEAPELQSEVKNFLKEPKIEYLEILEKVYIDYRALKTSEHLQSETQAFSGSARITRKAAREQNPTDGASKPTPILFRFPRNSDNKIPSDIYTQVREWFKRAIKPESDKTDADKEFLEKFVFKVSHSKKPPYKGPRAGGSERKYGNEYSDRRSRRSGYRSRSPSYERDRYIHYDHGPNRDYSARRGAYRERSRSPEARPQQDQSGQSANRDSRRTSSASFSPHGNSRNRYA